MMKIYWEADFFWFSKMSVHPTGYVQQDSSFKSTRIVIKTCLFILPLILNRINTNDFVHLSNSELNVVVTGRMKSLLT